MLPFAYTGLSMSWLRPALSVAHNLCDCCRLTRTPAICCLSYCCLRSTPQLTLHRNCHVTTYVRLSLIRTSLTCKRLHSAMPLTETSLPCGLHSLLNDGTSHRTHVRFIADLDVSLL
ncbi:hypothetical protein NDU88_003745 [Pleurodeles waltl]|uniref:Secreted protein n=1 Tax=Pleurodeles waltl TaxID=8319 RepID=A0AAV7V0U8_PLEWA|nr:hypothetical protein NDU88_003745 [Pleurodeles waltl]